ncbi:MAG: DUF72 domain-containing protein [Hyphomicrobiales bacterium]|nr:MAG: DUF72 domain-containing protein [Hyphomicrobiales bacterium]
MAGTIRTGIGGWTFPPWRGVFYPQGLPQKRELEYASRALNTIEINGTYYSSFKRATWAQWRAETPDDFVFSVKASRFATNRKKLADAAPSIEKFLGQGLAELGPKLGPINWQLANTKRFDPDDIKGFFALLPDRIEGVRLRHAVEARHESFDTPEFVKLAKAAKVAIVYAESADYPTIAPQTSDFTYARIMTAREGLAQGLPKKEIAALHEKAATWVKRGDVFVYFIAAAKVRNPAAAQAFRKQCEAGEPPAPGPSSGRPAAKVSRPRRPPR